MPLRHLAVVCCLLLVVVLAWSALDATPSGPSPIPRQNRSSSAPDPTGRDPSAVDPAAHGEHASAQRVAAGSGVGISTPAFELRVRQADGSPQPAANVWVWCGEDVQHCAADEHGVVRVDARPDAGGVFVVAPSMAGVVERFSTMSGTHELTVGGGATLGVRFVMPDGTPARQLDVRVRTQSDSVELPERVADSLFEAYPAPRNRFTNVAAGRTDDLGSLRVTGLRHGQRLTLQLPPESIFLLPDESPGFLPELGNALALTAPRTGLIVALRRMPTARGRVVWEDGSPVAGARVLTLATIQGSSQAGSSIADSDGAFEVGLVPSNRHDLDDVSSVKILWHCLTPYAPSRERSFDVEAIRQNPDLGDLVLQRPHQLHFRAVTPKGDPVAGAIAGRTGICSPTDADGRGFVWVGEELPEAFCCAAPGTMVARQPVAHLHGPDDPLVFVLPPTNLIEVQVHGLGPDIGGVTLWATGSEPAFLSARRFRGKTVPWLPSEVHDVVGPSDWTGGGSDGARLGIDGEGHAEVRAVIPGVSITFQLTFSDNSRIDGQHHRLLLAEKTIPSPPPGESLRVDLDVTAPTIELRGIVTDGVQPVPEATVQLQRRSDWEFASVETDQEGRFSITTFATAAEIEVQASKRGFALARQKLTTDQSVAGLVFALEPSFDLVVRLVDPDGAPVRASTVYAGSAPEALVPTMTTGVTTLDLGIGARKFGNLPAGQHPFRCTVGRDFVQEFDASAGEVTFTLPHLGTLLVGHRDPSGAAEARLWVRFEPVGVGMVQPRYRSAVTLERGANAWSREPILLAPGDYDAMYTKADGVKVSKRVTVVAQQTTPVWLDEN